MAHKLQVAAHRDSVLKINIWPNFLEYCGRPYIQEVIDTNLKKYNGWDLRGTDSVMFETEEDATAFKLRFG